MRILLVEDEPEVASLVKKTLLAEHHAVDVARTARRGEALALSEPYDLIILDLMLPDRDGLQLLRVLRAAGLEAPVLLLTARGEVSDRVAGLDAGADDYLVKPFAVAELRARVRALLRRGAPTREVVLQAGPLQLNPATHQVTLNGRAVELTSREYALLEYLLRNKGRLLSKGMIAEHVWDYHFASDYNLIEVYIRRLRRKLEQPGVPPLIHTVRHGGYVIRDPEE